MATCAICLQPIPSGSKFVLADTEVLHRACALAGGQTVLATMRQKYADLHVLLERALRVGEQSEQRAAELQRQRDLADRAATVYKSVGDQAADERDVARQERDRAIAERDEARRASLAANPVAVVEAPHEDDSVARFSLLELD